MSKGVKAVELALQLNQLNPASKIAVSLDMVIGILQVEIYEKYETENHERIYQSVAMLDDEGAVNAIIKDLEVMIGYVKER